MGDSNMMFQSPVSLSPTVSPTNENRVHKRMSNPSSSNSPAALNPRSCITCRKRKVKCDRRQPCVNCSKAQIECIFPSPGRAPRRTRKPPDTELLARLRRLEGVVQNLGAQVDDNDEADEKSEPNGTPAGDGVTQTNGPPPTNANDCQRKGTKGLERQFGRLMVDEGKSRYVSSSFWASINDQVEDIREFLEDSEEEEEDYPSPVGSGTSQSTSHQSFMFGFSSQINSLRSLHPSPEQISCLWELFKVNVDPLVKVLHIPTMEKTISEAKDNLDKIGKSMEALLFSIYFSVTTSLPPQECREVLNEEKDVLLARYRFGVEQGLARAGFLCTKEIVVLQAFVIFLICVRCYDDTRFVWTLTGLLIRLAHAVGLHRDGMAFNISPFETEQRRRLWWQICLLDCRSSQDHGSDPTILEQSFDTKLPLNVNDADLNPAMTEPPVEHQGATEVTFCLIRYEVSTTMRRLQFVPPGPGLCQQRAMNVTLQEKEKWIEDCHHLLETRYLRYFDLSVPLNWVTATVARLIMAKMWLIVYHPFQRQEGEGSLPSDTRDRLFMTSVEVLEYSHLLETEQRTRKWGWLFKTYVQWHAMAFILSELYFRTKGPFVDRAWRAIETSFEVWVGEVEDAKKGMLWRPMRKLMERARASRARAASEEQAVARQQFTFNNEPIPELSEVPVVHATMESLGFVGFERPQLTAAGIPASAHSTAPPPPIPLTGSLPMSPLSQMSTTNQWMVEDVGPPMPDTPPFPNAGDTPMNWEYWDNLVQNYDMTGTPARQQMPPGAPQQLPQGAPQGPPPGPPPGSGGQLDSWW